MSRSKEMEKFDLERLIRPNVAGMKAYSSARDEYSGAASVFLDANENPLVDDFNRYPDPMASQLKLELARQRGISVEQIFIGNGSDEAIDLLMRAFARPGMDKVAQFTPSYGMYSVSAELNDLQMIGIPLDDRFQVDVDQTLAILESQTPNILFACSPNNPTGNLLSKVALKKILKKFSGLLVVDEAYADFSDEVSWVEELKDHPNLVVMQTFSKAYGLAALRVGMAFASPEIIELLNRIKPPYNLNSLSQAKALEALSSGQLSAMVSELIAERKELRSFLESLSMVRKIYPSDANFLLVQFDNPSGVYENLREAGVIVRDRQQHVKGTLRISVGNKAENQRLKSELKRIEERQ